MSWAETNRIFDESCMLSLRRKVSPADASGSSTTIASPSIAPFFVPPKLSTSTPTSRVNARSGRSRDAAALETRAPSMCSCMPSAWTWSAIARSSSTEYSGAEFGGLRHRHDERLRAVLVAPAPRLAVDELGGELAVVGRDGQQLDPGDPLGCAALVDVDVGGGCRDHGAPAREHRLQADDVRAGAVEDRERLDALAEVVREHLLQPRGVLVLAVGDLVAVVRRVDRGEHLGVDAGVVVGSEAAEGRCRGAVVTVIQPTAAASRSRADLRQRRRTATVEVDAGKEREDGREDLRCARAAGVRRSHRARVGGVDRPPRICATWWGPTGFTCPRARSTSGRAAASS